MQNTVRTTIRIRKDLYDQSRKLAYQTNSSLQEVINSALAKGFGATSSLNSRKEAMNKINAFREGLRKQGLVFNVEKMIEENKKELQERTDRRLIRNCLKKQNLS